MIAIGLLIVVSVVISLLRSYSTWDAAAIWGAKGCGIARLGTIWAASEWGAYGLSYPLNIPLQIFSFALLDGDVVPGSKLVFPLYYASLALGLLAYFRREGSVMGAWAAAFVMALPIAFDHATQAYANLPFATYVVLGTLLAIRAALSGRRAILALSGIAFGLAVWTRPEGLPLVAAAYVALLLGARARGLDWRPSWEWVLPSVLIGGGWLAFGLARGETSPISGMLRAARTAVLGGDLHLTAFYWIGRYLTWDLLRPAVWGGLLPVVALGAVQHLRRSHSLTAIPHGMILATAVATGAFVLGFYYLISFSGDLQWWLDTGLSRMLLPSALLLAVWSVAPWVERARRLDPDRYLSRGDRPTPTVRAARLA